MQRIAVDELVYEIVRPNNVEPHFQYENLTPTFYDPYRHHSPRNLCLARLTLDQEAETNQRYLPYSDQQTLAFIRYYMNHVAPEATSLPAGHYAIEAEGQSFSFILDAALTYFDAMTLDELITHSHALMGCLLKPENKNRYYPAGSHLVAVHDANGLLAELCYFTTEVDIAIRQDKYGRMICDVINVALDGHGIYGAVYEIAGSFKHRYIHPIGIHYEPGGGRRLVKVVCENDNSSATFNYRADHESMMVQRLRHFQSRSTFFGMNALDKRLYAVSMRKFNGCDLKVLLDADLNQAPINDSDRFEIVLALLHAVSSQIFDQGVIHNDLKPDNIRVWKDELDWRIAIMDAGISSLVGVKDQLRIFAATYAPREAADGDRTTASDIFSLALVIAMLFRDRKQRNIESITLKGLIRLQRERSSWQISFDMFSGMLNFPDECKREITALLSAMTLPDQRNRPNIDTCIQQVKSIYQHYLALTTHLNANHVDNNRAKIFSERCDVLGKRLRVEIESCWQLINRYNDLYEKYVNDMTQDQDLLNNLRLYIEDFKNFTLRCDQNTSFDNLDLEIKHIQRKLEKMSLSFDGFQSLLGDEPILQNRPSKIR